MTLKQITNAANAFTDESYSTALVMHYVNQVIAMVNADIGSTLPFFANDTTEYVALSETWIRTLFIPYASYGIKQNDGSLNEASMFLNSFRNAFALLQQSKLTAIDVAYQGAEFGGIYLVDTSNAINIGWFQSNTDDDGFE